MKLTLKDIYDAEIACTSAGATYDELDAIVVDPGCLLVVTAVSVEDETTAYTRLQIGPAMGSSFFGILDEDAPAAAQAYYGFDELLITAYHNLRARLTGCTSGDKIRMHVQGYIYEIGV